jgi:uncharacterized protein YjbI with pentapeptide repeats
MSQGGKPGRPHYRVLSTKTIWIGALIMAAVAAGSVWLLLALIGQDPTKNNLLEIIRTAATIVVGTGGAVALLLAARRQRFVELDGTERRITDLQTKASDQLGSDQASVRLAGLFALERLAQDNPSHRQTIVDIICGYLRMPYTPPPQRSAPPRNAISLRPLRPAWIRPQPINSKVISGNDPRQERQVRLTAQRILAAHLRPEPKGRRGKPSNPKYWPLIDLDLAGAALVDLDLQRCCIRTGNFSRADFTGEARFGGMTCTEYAGFDGTAFGGEALFGEATFAKDARFDGAAFSGDVWFNGVAFSGDVWFGGTAFNGDARFGEVVFTGDAWFDGVVFTGDAWFDGTAFNGDARFGEVVFTGDAWFDGATFTRDARFGAATFTGTALFGGVTFSGDVWFNGAAFARTAWFGGAIFTGTTSFDETTLQNGVNFYGACAYRQTGPDVPRSVWPEGWIWGDITKMSESVRRAVADGSWHFLKPTENVDHAQNVTPTHETDS